VRLGTKSWLWRYLAALVTGFLSVAQGQDLHLESAGARFGAHPGGDSKHFYQAEGFANWALPWGWDTSSVLHLQLRFDTSLGWLGEQGANAAIANAGPTLCVRPKTFPVSLECGVSATVLTRSDFVSKDFGIPFQFTSHAGINFDVSSRFRLSYRFQHMSNAGLSEFNPGLNMHMLGLSYVF